MIRKRGNKSDRILKGGDPYYQPSMLISGHRDDPLSPWKRIIYFGLLIGLVLLIALIVAFADVWRSLS